MILGIASTDVQTDITHNLYSQTVSTLPSAQSPCLQSNENRSYKLTKAGSINWLNFGSITVPHVVTVQQASRQAHTFSSFIVIK